VHLLAALDHHSGVVLGQTVVDGKTNEITAFAPLCDRIDLTDALITADALSHPTGPRRVPARPRCAPRADREGHLSRPAQPAGRPALDADPARGHHQKIRFFALNLGAGVAAGRHAGRE
jgi:Transposase DDE domain